METRLVAVIRGRDYYEVVEDGRMLFTGSLAECRRFESLHDDKVVESLRDKRRRDRPQARIYRIWGRPASASGF